MTGRELRITPSSRHPEALLEVDNLGAKRYFRELEQKIMEVHDFLRPLNINSKNTEEWNAFIGGDWYSLSDSKK